MRYFPRLPPFLRVVSVVALLLSISSLVLFVAPFLTLWSPFHLAFLPQTPDTYRVDVIAANDIVLSLVCGALLNTYTRRFRQPDQAPFPLSSWRSQARWLALMGTLPLCAIILAVVISPAVTLFGLVFGVSLLGALLFLGAYLAMLSPASPVLRA